MYCQQNYLRALYIIVQEVPDKVKKQMKIPIKYRGNIYAYLFLGMKD